MACHSVGFIALTSHDLLFIVNFSLPIKAAIWWVTERAKEVSYRTVHTASNLQMLLDAVKLPNPSLIRTAFLEKHSRPSRRLNITSANFPHLPVKQSILRLVLSTKIWTMVYLQPPKGHVRTALLTHPKHSSTEPSIGRSRCVTPSPKSSHPTLTEPRLVTSLQTRTSCICTPKKTILERRWLTSTALTLTKWTLWKSTPSQCSRSLTCVVSD